MAGFNVVHHVMQPRRFIFHKDIFSGVFQTALAGKSNGWLASKFVSRSMISMQPLDSGMAPVVLPHS